VSDKPLTQTDELTAVSEGSREVLDDAVRLAAQIASSSSGPTGARLLRVRAGVRECVAESIPCVRPSDTNARVHMEATIERAIATGEVSVAATGAAIPVGSDGVVLAVIAVDTECAAELSAVQVEQLLMLASVISGTLRHDAIVGALEQEAERSRRLDRLKSEFLNIAAHELRSPLGVIRGYASMLSEGMLPEADRAVALARIAQKSEEMARLISEMLETARLETMGLDLALATVDLAEVVADAVNATRPLLSERHRMVVHDHLDGVIVVADRVRLTTVFTNLIDNAVKYSPAGGEIAITCDRDEHEATVRVRDEGIGINAEQVHRLFTRFGRVVTPETSHIRGTGLGLYFARETARLHGGDIQVESEPGHGTTFSVVLPRQ
jgi:signal transduction histidine kinase